MCNHVYTTNQRFWPRNIGQRCPYPEFYAALDAARVENEGTAAELPIDSTGACIFHSQDLDWKRANDFQRRFLELLSFLDATELDRYDFAEFVVVGADAAREKGGAEHRICLADNILRKPAFFRGARFTDPVDLERIDFQGGADFTRGSFSGPLRITDSHINSACFDGVEFGPAQFVRVRFDSYTSFSNARFSGTLGGGYAVLFQDSQFDGITDFSSATFQVGDDTATHFERVRFEESVDFTGTRFDCNVVFTAVVFNGAADFIDTAFEVVRSKARHHGAAVEFKALTVTARAVVAFRSTDPAKKLFQHDVEMSFNGDPEGSLRFENVNLALFSLTSRNRLLELARTGHVEIGPGCIKYRLQTNVQTVPVDRENGALVVEMCQTFTNYFTGSNGLNLGFEIVARDQHKISFFYFTDEDISYEEFLARLANTERNLWSLLSIGSDARFLSISAQAQSPRVARAQSAMINTVDGLSALLGTFFRVGARIALGRWKMADTAALLNAIQFNDDEAEARAETLHRTLTERYSDTSLIKLNQRQNDLLLPMAAARQEASMPAKQCILFLGANTTEPALSLEVEVSRIDTLLRLAEMRDSLELKQKWAVTSASMIQAIVDFDPAIVHFAGHGDPRGIVLFDERGNACSVSGEALASLFELYATQVRCVVLSSCFSDVQAKAIRHHIPHVVGSRTRIEDEAAVAFSTGFYTGIGAGKDIPFAFELGIVSVNMAGFNGKAQFSLI